jgi:hypothetical protein
MRWNGKGGMERMEGDGDTHDIQRLERALADERPRNGRDPGRGGDVAIGGVLEKVVGDRHDG